MRNLLNGKRSLFLGATLIGATAAGTAAASFSGTNLVPNPFFRDYSRCPEAPGEIANATPWVSAGYSPDFFHYCAAFNPGGPNGVWAPGSSSNSTNFQGWQCPLDGVAAGECFYEDRGYAGVVAYYEDMPGPEYIKAPLDDELKANTLYSVSFHVSLGDYSSLAIDSMGALLTDTDLYSNSGLYSYTPQIQNQSGLLDNTDYLTWTKISGTFYASGGERYIIIGNFEEEPTVEEVDSEAPWPHAYYYIDGVEVVEVGEGG